MDRYIYEARFTPEPKDGGYSIEFPELDGAITQADNFQEGVIRAAGVLELIVSEYLDEGRPLPKPVFHDTGDDMRVVVSVSLSDETRKRMRCVTVSQAAEILKLSKGRVCHMLDSGILASVPYGRERLVTLASINVCKAAPRASGRPKKAATS